ncbi:MAG TPA: ATPase domain-containing protein [Candidatus Acidoferrum sp.]|nr:ATPase domain-containing protein [Candidatus Acidoferrum sp.]
MPSPKDAKKSSITNRLSSGIEELDHILGGGFPARRLFLIEGAPGSGKTTLALQFLLAGSKNSEKGVYVTFSESEDEVRAVAESHGWTLDGINLQELSTLGDRLKNEEQYTVFQPADVELSETLQRVIDDVRRLKPQRVVIDSLSEIRLVARDPLRYRRQILALKEILSECNCSVFILEDYTVGNPDLLLQSIAHGVVLLEKTQSEYGSVKRTLQVTKLRAGPSLEGSHDFVIRRGGLQVFRRLIASDSLDGEPPKDASGLLKTTNEELDRLIGGGVRWGTGLVLVGPAGTGKSTVGMQIVSAAAQQGYKTCVFLFDEAKVTYVKRGKNVDLDLAGHIAEGLIELHQIDPNEQSPGEFAYRLRRKVEDEGVRVVVIDSLNGYLTAMTSERFLLAQLHELLAYLNAHGVLTIMTTAQHGMLNTTDTTSFELTYLADLVIYLRYFEAGGSVRKAISVIKNRLSAHETCIREFEITAKGLEIGTPLRQFEGILSGIPKFLGETEDLLNSQPKSGSKGAAAG